LVDKKDKITLSHSEIFLRKDGIVFISFIKDSAMDLNSCNELYVAYTELLDEKKYPFLYVIGDYVTFTNEARNYFSTKKGSQYSRVDAFVFTSLAHKLLANFYMKVNKPKIPTKFFNSKNEAEAWLTKYL